LLTRSISSISSRLATPAAANGRLFVRGSRHLFCFGPK
jgi:hypothetical protein